MSHAFVWLQNPSFVPHVEIMMRPKVDIAIATYNQEKLVAETIESALAQSYGDLIISIYDDNSSDGTESVCRAYAGKDKRIVYRRNPSNLGDVGNFQTAIDNSHSEFLTILHGDDVLYPDFIRETVENGLIRNPKAAFAYALHERIVGGVKTGEMFQFVPALRTGVHDLLKYLCLTNWIITSFAVIRRENLRRIGELNRYTAKGTFAFIDHYLFSALATTGPVYVVNERLGGYRIHEDTSTARLAKSKRYKEGAIHCYDVIYQDAMHFEDKYRYLARANQIGRLLTSRGIVASAFDMLNSMEIRDLMATIAIDLATTLEEALDSMVFDSVDERAQGWRLESMENVDAFVQYVRKNYSHSRSGSD